MMRNYILLFTIIGLFLQSCEKKEIPIPVPPPGDLTIQQIEMGGYYKNQLFYSLKNNEVVSQNIKTIWDLSFESSDEGWHVLLNSSKLMAAYFYEERSFSDELNLDEASWTWDTQSGSLDSTAIGDWRNLEGIYVIDRGYNHVGTHKGYKKLQLISSNSQTFEIRYASLNGDEEMTLTVNKDKTLNYTPFSFEPGSEFPEVMPDKNTWDLEFTQYTFIYYDLEEITPYLVVGVLLNRNNVKAILKTDINFEDIDLDYATQIEYSNAIDAIGHDWKYYNFDEGFYSVLSEKSYVIIDIEGVYYKLHFIDFYTETGEKGAPKFEFQKL